MYALSEEFEFEDLPFKELVSTDEISVLIELNELERARKYIIEGLERDPNNIEYKILLIKLIIKQGDLATAEKLALEATKAYPENRVICGELADIYIKQYKIEQAKELVNRSLNNGIIDEISLGQMITILNSQDRFEEALDFAENSSRKFPSNDSLRGQLINSLIGSKDFNRALLLINRSITMYELELKDILEAETISNNDMQSFDLKTVKKLKGYLLTIRQLININIRKKKYNVAAPLISDLANKFPDSEVINEQEISMLISQEKFKEAEEKALIVLSKNPNNEIVKSNLITIYSKMNQHYKANQLIHQDIDNPNTPLSTYKIRIGQAVTILVKGNRLEAAVEVAKKGIEKLPYCRILKDKLLDILTKLRRYDEAIELNLGLIEEFPNAVEFKKKLNDIRHKKEQYMNTNELYMAGMERK